MTLFRSTAAIVLALGVTFATPALAQKKYDTGASDTEIKVGQTIPLSGPASAYGSIGKVQANRQESRLLNVGDRVCWEGDDDN